MRSRSGCDIDPVLDIIGDQWMLAIIHQLSAGPRRALELHSEFTGMSSKTITSRLKKLERNRVVQRRSYPESPPRVEYSLTEKGLELLPVMRAIAAVASKWAPEAVSTSGGRPCLACAAHNMPARPPVRIRPRRLTDVTLL